MILLCDVNRESSFTMLNTQTPFGVTSGVTETTLTGTRMIEIGI